MKNEGAKMIRVKGYTIMIFPTRESAVLTLNAFPSGIGDVTLIDYKGRPALMNGAGASKLGLS